MDAVVETVSALDRAARLEELDAETGELHRALQSTFGASSMLLTANRREGPHLVVAAEPELLEGRRPAGPKVISQSARSSWAMSSEPSQTSPSSGGGHGLRSQVALSALAPPGGSGAPAGGEP